VRTPTKRLFLALKQLARGLRPSQIDLLLIFESLSLDTSLDEIQLEVDFLKDVVLFLQSAVMQHANFSAPITQAINAYAIELSIEVTELKDPVAIMTSISQQFAAENPVDANRSVKYNKRSDFTAGVPLRPEDASGLFSHEIMRSQLIAQARTVTDNDVKVDDDENPANGITELHEVFIKWNPDKSAAMRELFVLELTRLVIPSQPITQLCKDPVTGKVYLVSQGDLIGGPESQKLERMDRNQLRAMLASGDCTELGSVLMSLLFFNDRDGKPGNMLVSPDKKVKRIDGGWGLAGLVKSKYQLSPAITTEDIINFPYVTTVSAHHFLDIIIKGRRNFDFYLNHDKMLINYDLLHNPVFSAQLKKDAYQTLLNLLLFSKEFIKRFLGRYSDNQKEINLVATEIMRLSKDFRHAAIYAPGFQDYLMSDAATEYVAECVKRAREFIPFAKPRLGLPEEAEFVSQLATLRSDVARIRLQQGHGASHVASSSSTPVDALAIDLDNFVLPSPPKLIGGGERLMTFTLPANVQRRPLAGEKPDESDKKTVGKRK
jgi:hypothetical protein